MSKGILGRKVGMTQIYDETGNCIPVTVVQAGPCRVLQIRTLERDGYEAIQLGFLDKPRRLARKSERGHVARLESKRSKKLAAAGELVGAEGLAPPTQARLVRAGKDGKPVTDGVFPETKEFLAGYWIVDVPDAERAYQIAAEASAAPGVGGAPMNMPIEVRQVPSGPPPTD